MIQLLPRTCVEHAIRIALVLCCAVVGAGDVVAQSAPEGIIGNVIRGSSNQSYASEVLKQSVEAARRENRGGTQDLLSDQFTLKPLPGGDGIASDISSNPSEFAPNGNVDSVIRNSVGANQVTLQPLSGQAQLSNSDPVVQWIVKRMNDKSATAMATLTNVDNGAAFGATNAFNMTNGLMRNVMDAHYGQLNSLKLTDPTGLQSQAYLARVHEIIGKPGQGSAPGAVIAAIGDNLDEKKNKTAFSRMPDSAASGLETLPCAAPFVDPKDGSKVVKLSDLSFCPEAVSDANKAKIAEILAKKHDFLTNVGEVWIKLLVVKDGQGNENPAATKVEKLMIRPPADSKGRRGLKRVQWEHHVAVFEALGVALSGYCTYRTSNKNWGQDMWSKKKTPSMILREDPDGLMKMNSGSAWHYATAPDMPLTEGFVEQLYLHVVKTSRVPTIAECKSLAVKEADMPTSTAAGTATVNDCTKDKGCLRNRLLFFVSGLIARSKTLHFYKQVIWQTQAFLRSNDDREMVNDLLKVELGPDFDLDEEIVKNQEAFRAYKELQSKFFQGQVGGSNFLANMDSNSPQGFTQGRK